MSPLHTLLNSSKDLLLCSVADGSRNSYKTGWLKWLQFVRLIKTSPLLDKIPRDFLKPGVSNGLSFPVAAAISFLSYLTDHDFGVCVTPSTALNYWSAVRFHLLIYSDLDVKTFDDSRPLKAARKGLMNKWYSDTSNLLAARRTLPFTLDLIWRAFNVPIPGASTAYSCAVHAAMCVGYTFLCRVGEYLYTGPKSSHHLLTKDIAFLTNSGIDQEPELKTAMDIRNVPPNRIKAIILTIRSAKNDQQGKARRYTLRTDKTSKVNAKFFSHFLEHNRISCPETNAPFFSSSVEKWTLTSSDFNFHLKFFAKTLSVQEKRISTHSLRIAGACALSNAGVADSVILLMGRWRSLAFLDYLRDTTTLQDSAFSVLLNPNTLKFDHLVDY